MPYIRLNDILPDEEDLYYHLEELATLAEASPKELSALQLARAVQLCAFLRKVLPEFRQLVEDEFNRRCDAPYELADEGEEREVNDGNGEKWVPPPSYRAGPVGDDEFAS